MPGAALECVICTKRYSLSQIISGLYFLSTGVCTACYDRMRDQPRAESCFAKPLNKKGTGYDEDSVACRKLCPDREVCKEYLTMRKRRVIDITDEARKKAAKLLAPSPDPNKREREIPFREGTAIGSAYKLCCRGCTIAEFNKLADASGCKRSWLLRILRKETIYGFSWTWQEDRKHYKVIPAENNP